MAGPFEGVVTPNGGLAGMLGTFGIGGRRTASSLAGELAGAAEKRAATTFEQQQQIPIYRQRLIQAVINAKSQLGDNATPNMIFGAIAKDPAFLDVMSKDPDYQKTLSEMLGSITKPAPAYTAVGANERLVQLPTPGTNEQPTVALPPDPASFITKPSEKFAALKRMEAAGRIDANGIDNVLSERWQLYCPNNTYNGQDCSNPQLLDKATGTLVNPPTSGALPASTPGAPDASSTAGTNPQVGFNIDNVDPGIVPSIRTNAAKYGLDPKLLAAQLQQEGPIDPRKAGIVADHLSAMMAQLNTKYGDPALALLAKSWGQAATDDWIKKGADPAMIPAKDRNYIQSVLGMAAGSNGTPQLNVSAADAPSNAPTSDLSPEGAAAAKAAGYDVPSTQPSAKMFLGVGLGGIAAEAGGIAGNVLGPDFAANEVGTQRTELKLLRTTVQGLRLSSRLPANEAQLLSDLVPDTGVRGVIDENPLDALQSMVHLHDRVKSLRDEALQATQDPRLSSASRSDASGDLVSFERVLAQTPTREDMLQTIADIKSGKEKTWSVGDIIKRGSEIIGGAAKEVPKVEGAVGAAVGGAPAPTPDAAANNPAQVGIKYPQSPDEVKGYPSGTTYFNPSDKQYHRVP